MKSKGFTLSEILGVIVIIGLLLLLTAPLIISRLKSNDEVVDSASKKIIYSAASEYINENKNKYLEGRSYCIPIKALIDDGKLTEQTVNITTGQSLKDYSVYTTIYSRGNVDYDLKSGDCQDGIALPIITFTVSDQWVSKSKEVIINYPIVGNNTFPLQGSDWKYNVDGNTWTNLNSTEAYNGKNNKVHVSTNGGTVYAKMKYGDNTISAKIKVDGIDKTNPTIKIHQFPADDSINIYANCKDDNNAVITLSDEGGSKLDKYAITTDQNPPSTFINLNNKQLSKATVKYKVTNNGIYYVHVYDKAGQYYQNSFNVLIKHTLTYNANTSSGTTNATISKNNEQVTNADKYNLATAERTGYTFNGWFTDTQYTKEVKTNDNICLSSDRTLYAKWTAKTYTIAYNLNSGRSGSSVPTAATFDRDVTISNPAKTVTITGNANGTGATVGTATSANQTFAGWTSSTAAGLQTNAKSAASANPTTAWTGTSTKNTHFMNLRNEPGTVTLTANWTANAVKLPTLTKSGYTCKWYTDKTGGTLMGESGANWTPAANSSSNITAYARCETRSYTINYALNNGTKGTNSPSVGVIDADVAIPYPTKRVTVTGSANGTGAAVGAATGANQTFAGWTSSTSAGLQANAKSGTNARPTTSWNGSKTTNTHFMNLRNESGTVTLTANWTPVAVTLPTLTKTGYTCRWYTASTGGTLMGAGGAKWTPAANSVVNISAYARCTSGTYKISFNGNGNTSGSTADATCTYDKACTLTANGFAKTGYTFKGWATSASGNKVYNNQASVTNLAASGTVTLYAKWADETAPTITATGESTWTNKNIEIKLTATENGSGIDHWEGKAENIPKLKINSHVQNLGWLGGTGAGYIANIGGTTKLDLRMEAFKLSLTSGTYSGSIEYASYVDGKWQAYKKDGAISGTENKGLPIKAVKIKLTGDLADHYNVKYRAYLDNDGWKDYVTNDTQTSKPTANSKNVQALQVLLTYKKSITGNPNNWSAIASSAKKSITRTYESGNKIVYYRACDKAGNCSASKSQIVQIDKKDPACVTTIKTTSESSVKAYTPCNDATSRCNGVSKISTKSGEQKVTMTDAAGNTKTCKYTVTMPITEPQYEQYYDGKVYICPADTSTAYRANCNKEHDQGGRSCTNDNQNTRYNRMIITPKSIDGSKFTFHLLLQNNTQSSSGGDGTLTACFSPVSNAKDYVNGYSSACYNKSNAIIKTISSYGFGTTQPINMIDEDFTVDLSSWAKGEYRIILVHSGGSGWRQFTSAANHNCSYPIIKKSS